MNKNKCVHTEHCCILHGCKYNDDDCPVENNIKPQSCLCESCSFQIEENGYSEEVLWARIRAYQQNDKDRPQTQSPANLLAKIAEDIVCADDGYYVYWPRNCGKGYLSSYILRTIANELDQRNAAWDQEISDYFERKRNEETRN